MIYLTTPDFEATLRAEDIIALGADNPSFLQPAERLALAEVQRELSTFDTEAALAPFAGYDVSLAFPAGARIFSDADGYFHSTQAVPPGTLLTNTAYWTPGDNRPAELVNAVLRITLSHLAGRFTTGPIPPAIEALAQAARAWLHSQATGESPAILPKLPATGPGRYGSIARVFDGKGIW